MQKYLICITLYNWWGCTVYCIFDYTIHLWSYSILLCIVSIFILEVTTILVFKSNEFNVVTILGNIIPSSLRSSRMYDILVCMILYMIMSHEYMYLQYIVAVLYTNTFLSIDYIIYLGSAALSLMLYMLCIKYTYI